MNLLKVAALVAAGVSRYANPVPRSRYGADWDESKHPRGNAKNAGQFTAGQSVKVGDSVGSKIKGGSVGKIVSGPHSIGGVTGQYLVDHNGTQEHHHGSRLTDASKKDESSGKATDASPQKANLSEQAKTLSTIAEGHSQRAEQAKPGDANFAQLHATAAESHKTAAQAHSAANKAGFQAHPVLKGHHATLAWRHETMAASHDGAATSAQGLVAEQEKEDTTAPPPGGYSPDPAQGKAARVGVPGDVVPPPPKKIPRLNNLNPEERAVESKFAEMFEKDPDGLTAKTLEQMKIPKGQPGYMGIDAPNIFGTDDVKMMFPEWRGTSVTGPDGKMDLSPETKAFRSKYNTALHQTANALAKKAFVKYLDDVVAKLPPEKRQVLVTAGGVAAGKGYAISNVSEVNAISQKAAATWDTAGEQNSTELPWVAEECKKRGISMTAVYVHARPQDRWENPGAGVIERAGKKGRMVDARAFADSYTHGARNFDAFHQKYGKDPFVHVAILDNTGKVPQQLSEVPRDAVQADPEKLYADCMAKLAQTNAPDAVKEGGSAGARIWGPPDGIK